MYDSEATDVSEPAWSTDMAGSVQTKAWTD